MQVVPRLLMASFTHLVSSWLNSPSSQLTETPTVEAIFRVIENTQYHEEVSTDHLTCPPATVMCLSVPRTGVQPPVYILPVIGGF